MKDAAIKAALKFLIADRDCLYEAITLKDGTVPNPDDKKDLADIDAVIDQCQAALDTVPRRTRSPHCTLATE